MAVKDALLPEFDQEMAATRRVLERAPEAAFAWRPHPQSYDLGGLATHLAQIPHWGMTILTHDFHDVAASPGKTTARSTVAEILALFDGHVSDVRASLVELPDGHLQAPWALKRGANLILSMPRIAAIRSFVLHHAIHHRGQLTVYLRVHDVPVPPLYGPTSDELM